MRPVCLWLLSCLLLCTPAVAATTEAAPEITRSKPFDAQARGVEHALRVIPEACVRLHGVFNQGAASQPYSLRPVRSAAQCQPRARFVEAERFQPSTARGWVLNDRIRVAAAECPGHAATVTIWRKPAGIQPLALDAQGRARIYLDEAKQQAVDDMLAKLALYTAQVQMDGAPCGT